MSQSSKNTVSQYERKFKSMILVSDLQVFDQVHSILTHWTMPFNISVWTYIAYSYSLGLMMLVFKNKFKMMKVTFKCLIFFSNESSFSPPEKYKAQSLMITVSWMFKKGRLNLHCQNLHERLIQSMNKIQYVMSSVGNVWEEDKNINFSEGWIYCPSQLGNFIKKRKTSRVRKPGF